MTTPRCTALKLYGERNTATRYFRALVLANLEVYPVPGTAPRWLRRAAIATRRPEPWIDAWFACTPRRHLGWVHACGPSPGALRRNRYGPGLAWVTLTKNPYAWLLSLYARPYHRRGPPAASFTDFLEAPWPTLRRDGLPRVVANPVTLWNLKNAAYARLADECGARNLTSERLIEDPEASIDALAQRFGIPRKPGLFRNIEPSTKDESKRYDDYRAYYGKELWRAELSDDAIAKINADIDRSLMERFGYAWIDAEESR